MIKRIFLSGHSPKQFLMYKRIPIPCLIITLLLVLSFLLHCSPPQRDRTKSCPVTYISFDNIFEQTCPSKELTPQLIYPVNISRDNSSTGQRNMQQQFQIKTKFPAGCYDYLDIKLRYRMATFKENIDVTLSSTDQENRIKSPFEKSGKDKPISFSLQWETGNYENFPFHQTIDTVLHKNNNEWSTYRLFLGDNPFWRDTITSISIFGNRPHIYFTIEEIIAGSSQSRNVTKRYKIDRQTRQVNLVSSRNTLRSTVDLPEYSVLEFGLAWLRDDEDGKPANVNCELSVISPPFPKQLLFSRKIVSESKLENKWHDFSFSLNSYGGCRVTLEWSLSSINSDFSSSEIPAVLLSDPCLLTSEKIKSYSNVILISIDTLRADHLGCYGYPLSISPFLDRFAKSCLTAMQTISPYPCTSPAHATLMTGLSPEQHGVIFSNERLHYNNRTLAEVFRQNGYLTTAYTGGGFVSAFYRFDKGFWMFDDENRSVDAVVTKALPWIEQYADFPFFLFYHTYQVHSPYSKHAPLVEYFHPGYHGKVTGKEKYYDMDEVVKSKEDREYLVALYDTEIRYSDGKIGEFFIALDEMNMFRNTHILVLSDHGDHFQEHGLFGHNNSLYHELLDVPLLIYNPQASPKSDYFQNPIGLIDIPALICRLLDFPNAFPDYRRSLFRKNGQSYELDNRPVLSELHISKNNIVKKKYALIDKTMKYITTENGKNEELFMLPSEESISQNMADDRKDELSAYRQKLQYTLQELSSAEDSNDGFHEGETVLDEDIESALQALGYLY